MKATKLLAILLALCLTITMLASCDSTKPSESTEPIETECTHKFNQGYCAYCNELDPDCIELTSENCFDFLDIQFRIADQDGKVGPIGFIAFPHLYLIASAKSDRITFYNVSVELEITVQYELDSNGKYEECTTTVAIPVSLLGEGTADAELEFDLISLDDTHIPSFNIVSVTGCISIN